MADRMAGEIWIGGKLPRSLLDAFPIDDLRLDWDENPVDGPRKRRCWQAVKTTTCISAIARRLTASFRNWRAGCGSTISRSSGSRRASTSMILLYGVSPRSAGHTRQEHIDHSGRCPVICDEEIAKAMQSMAKLVKDKNGRNERLQAWERIYSKLNRLIPPTLPPLPPFEIVDG